MYLATVFTGLAIVVLFLVYWLRGRKDLSKSRICILVLGDIGRSPRMQYHALSFAKAGYQVDLVGFGGICIIYLFTRGGGTGGGGRGGVGIQHVYKAGRFEGRLAAFQYPFIGKLSC